MKYRKKPVVIEAYQYNYPLYENEIFQELPDWLKEARADAIVYYKNNRLTIKTLEGEHTVTKGDYIIRGVKGELYPCKPDIFEATYDLVE